MQTQSTDATGDSCSLLPSLGHLLETIHFIALPETLIGNA